ncbi:MAG: hypothetical protein WBW73_22060 [Rhodoplanes sp.]
MTTRSGVTTICAPQLMMSAITTEWQITLRPRSSFGFGVSTQRPWQSRPFTSRFCCIASAKKRTTGADCTCSHASNGAKSSSSSPG